MPVILKGKGNWVAPSSNRHYFTDAKLISAIDSKPVGLPANEIVGIYSPAPEIGGTLLSSINFNKTKKGAVKNAGEGGRIKFVF